MEEAMIKEILSKKRQYEAEFRFLSSLADEDNCSLLNDALAEKRNLEMLLKRIDLWLALLSEDEVFVITRHLIDRIDVPRIVLEYERKWGGEFGKTERTIKMYQSRALKKIAEFESKHDWLQKISLSV